MIGRLNTQEIESMLSNQLIGRIGCHSDGVTYVVPISYSYDGKNIYGHSFEGMKLTMMRKNPSVCFEVENMKDISNWQSLICQGHFAEIKDEAEKRLAFQSLVGRYMPFPASETIKITPLWPFSTKEFEEVKGVLFKIVLLEKTGYFEMSNGFRN